MYHTCFINSLCEFIIALRGIPQKISSNLNKRISVNHAVIIIISFLIGNTILNIAAESGHEECASWILDNYTGLKVKERAINIAAMHGHVKVLKLMAQRGLGTDEVDEEGKTESLHFIVPYFS